MSNLKGSFRLPTEKGKPVWRLSNVQDNRFGEGVKLYDAIVAGKTMHFPKPYIERELERQEQIAQMDVSETMRKKLGRAQSFAVQQTSTYQFQQFIAKMPAIIEGMVALEKQGVKLPPNFKRRLNSIIKKLNEMTPEERANFYFENSEEFNEAVDWYKLARKYGYKPSDLFELDESDIQSLNEMGFDSYDEFVEGVYDDLGALNTKLNSYRRKS